MNTTARSRLLVAALTFLPGCAGRESPSVSLIALLEHNHSSIEKLRVLQDQVF